MKNPRRAFVSADRGFRFYNLPKVSLNARDMRSVFIGVLLPYAGIKRVAKSMKISSLGILFILTACSQAPIVHIQYVNIPQFLPIPATLTTPVKADLPPGITWGGAVGNLYSELQTCNSDKAAIASLKPSPPR